MIRPRYLLYGLLALPACDAPGRIADGRKENPILAIISTDTIAATVGIPFTVSFTCQTAGNGWAQYRHGTASNVVTEVPVRCVAPPAPPPPPPTPPPAGARVWTSPATVTAISGSTASVTVNLDRTYFTGTVMFDLDYEPAGVTGVFNPVSTTGSTSTLTLSVGSAVTPGTYPLAVYAIGSPGNRATLLSLTVTTGAVPPPSPPPPTTSYTTSFDLTENPLSEGGRWVHNDVTGTFVRTVNGAAYGTQTGVGPYVPYDDSNAHYPGFGTDYSIEGTIVVNPASQGNDWPYNEVELLLRWSDGHPLRNTAYGPTQAIGYEINVHHNGDYLQLGRFKGALLAQVVPPLPRTGDRFKATIAGQTITVYWNGVEVLRYTDNDATNRITTGNPGIGFFHEGPANTDFGFSSVSITRP